MRVCQPSAWAEVATFLIKRKWPKIDQGGPWTPSKATGCAGGSGLARRLFRGRFQASAAPWLGWLLPREAGLRRQSRHPCKANTERRSGRGTRVCGVIPFRFCCPAAILRPAGGVSSLPVESPAVVQPAATGGGGNGSGTERRLVLAVGFPKGCPLWSVFGYFLLIKKVT